MDGGKDGRARRTFSSIGIQSEPSGALCSSLAEHHRSCTRRFALRLAFVAVAAAAEAPAGRRRRRCSRRRPQARVRSLSVIS